MKHELFKTVCMKKWMIVLLAMIIVMPLSSDLYAASKKNKKKGTATATLPAPKKVNPYEKLLKGKNVETSKSDFITLHKVGSKLYFEMPTSVFLSPYKTVCEGYSESFKILCDKAGIPKREKWHAGFCKTVNRKKKQLIQKERV